MFRGFRWVRLLVVLLATLALGAEEPSYGEGAPPDPSNVTARPSSSQGNIAVRNGSVDAVHGSLSLAFPLGPKTSGRIAGGFAWAMQGWRGAGDWSQTTRFHPVLWPRVSGERMLTLAGTARRRGVDLLDWLTRALNARLVGLSAPPFRAG